MLRASWMIGLLALAQAPGQTRNPVYEAVSRSDLTISGARVALRRPTLPDGLGADDQRRALLGMAGSPERLEELLRDSVTAPFVLKVRDEKAESGDVIRQGDLWFVIRADLDRIDPSDVERLGSGSKPVEAGNMRVSSRVLDAASLKKRGIEPPGEQNGAPREWYVHLLAGLLDRIEVQATDRVTASRSGESWLIASRTDPKFARDEQFPNGWSAVDDKGELGPPRPYDGGASYVKITRLAVPPGALLVEAHFAFAEPHDWFDGAPILRSKFSLIAQDRIRRLRRELIRSQPGGELRK